MNSTDLIKASQADYKMLKEKGKEGEEVLHYNGFLDGWGCGFGVGKEYAINKACEWLKRRHNFATKEYIKEMITEFRKAMEEEI